MTDRPAPRCPHCGQETVLRDWHDVFFGKGNCYECACGARTPIKVSPDAAYSAAMARYVEANRVLTLAEAAERAKAHPLEPLYMDTKEQNVHGSGAFTRAEGVLYITERPEEFPGYNERWVFWLRRPTDEEREAAGWSD